MYVTTMAASTFVINKIRNTTNKNPKSKYIWLSQIA